MTRRGGYRLARLALVLWWLGSSWQASAQLPPSLAQPVALVPGRRPLGAVLAELSRQSQLPLSYSSSLVPLSHPCLVRPGPARPLGVVLRELLGAEQLSYGLLAGQLVLWPNRAAVPPGVTAINGEVARPHRPATNQAGRVILPAAVSNTSWLKPPSSEKPAFKHHIGAHQVRIGRSNDSKAVARTVPAFVAASPTSRHAATQASTSLARQHRRMQAAPAASVALVASAGPSAGRARARGTQLTSSTRREYSPSHKYSKARPAANTDAGAPPAAKPVGAAASIARSLALLPMRPVSLLPANPLPPAARELAGLRSGPASNLSATTPTADQRPDAGKLPKKLYLHGEAWLSESLPVGGTIKVGLPRVYLLLGAATGPLGHHSGPAWGVGLGTVGRARGRFTPSLDLVQWFLAGDHDSDTEQAQLLQLRPLLAWQLKREGRFCLMAGPTFNLALAQHHGPTSQHWDFGRNQWLWADKTDDQSTVRFWPGVQVGIRF